MAQQELEAIARHEAAKKRLLARVRVSESNQNYIMERLKDRVIVDRMVWPSELKFALGYESPHIRIPTPESPARSYNFHRHALGQMADVVGLPRLYLSRLLDTDEVWRRELLDENFNTLFQKTLLIGRNKRAKRFLVRSVGDQIRGFLSQNYNRKLTTARTLRSFIEACRMHHAGPVSVDITDIRFRTQYMLPTIFEPVDGEVVAFGASYTNSDFGAGRLSIGGTIMRIGSSLETTAVLTDKYSRTHLGPIIQDTDIEMSEETDDKEVSAVQSAIRDIVKYTLSEESIEKTLRAIQLAHEREIPWHQLKGKLKELLNQQELQMLELALTGKALSVDLPPIKDDMATGWWAANAVGALANNEGDLDRRADLQAMAGQLISG